MNKPHIYLTPDEEKALRILADSRPHFVLKEANVIPTYGLSIFLSNLRRKTGIRDTKNSKEIRAYFSKYEEAMAYPGFSPEELDAVRKIIDEGAPFEEAAIALGRTVEQIEAALQSACATAGIFSRDEKTQRLQLKTYLALFNPVGNQSLSEQELQLLRLYSEDVDYAIIAYKVNQRTPWVTEKIRDLCLKLGLNSRGRGTQRQLVRAWLAHKAATSAAPAQEPSAPEDAEDPMNDPLL